MKYRYQNQSEVPAELAAHYTEHNGTWVLNAEGAVDKSTLDEFHATNLALTKERDELKHRFEGIDPDQVRQLAEEKRKLEEAQQLKAGEFEKVLETRVKTVRAELEKQLSALTSEKVALNKRLSAIQIDQTVTTAATKRGLRPTAIPDILARARDVFRLVDGLTTAFEPDGQTVRPGKDGLKSMTPEEWVDSLVAEAPHLFESNAGAGAAGNASGGAANAHLHSARNPFRKDTWNLTEQMRLQKSDPNLAARLKAAA